jgi:hypothetical protein
VNGNDVARVVGLLTNGTYAREDVEDVLALLVLGTPSEARGLDEDGAMLLGRFALRAGVKPGATADEARDIIADYYSRNPPNEALVAALFSLAREKVLSEGGALDNLLAAFSGNAPPPGVLGGGERTLRRLGIRERDP